MTLPKNLNFLLRVPQLTRARTFLAVAVAVTADGTQLLLGPFGWVFLDQAIDCMAAVLITWILGFHILLLPTFLVELVPGIGELPTWTACTAAVITLRKREQRRPASPDQTVIDI